jgi:hypothetical protein
MLISKKNLIFFHFLFKNFLILNPDSGSNCSRLEFSKLILEHFFSVVSINQQKNFLEFEDTLNLEKQIKYYFRYRNSSRGISRISKTVAEFENSGSSDKYLKAIEKIFKKIIIDPFMKKIAFSKIVLKDLIQNRFIATNVGYIAYSDSSERFGIFITFLQCAASRLILSHIVTIGQPTGLDVVQLLDSVFKNRDSTSSNASVYFLHTDLGGAFMSHQVFYYLSKKNITHSFSKGYFHNNIIERSNSSLWGIILNKVRFRFDLDGRYTFQELSDLEDIKNFIAFGIDNWNRRRLHFSNTIPRNFSSLDLFKALEVYKMSSNKIFSRDSPDGFRIAQFYELAVLSRQQALLENKIFIESNLPVQVTNNFIRQQKVVSVDIPLDFILTEKDKAIKTNKFLNAVQNVDFSLEDDPFAVFFELAEKNNISRDDLPAMGIILNLSLTKEVALLKNQIENMNNRQMERDSLERNLMLVRAERKQRRKKNALISRDKRFGIFWSDFDLIITSITSRFALVRSRDRVLHFLLKAFGFRISNCQYVSWSELNSLKNGKAMRLRNVKTQTDLFSDYPYYPFLRKYFKLLAKDFAVLEAYSIEVHNNCPDFPLDRSEFWGDHPKCSITIHAQMKRINKQLKLFAAKLEQSSQPSKRKFFTSHSYRRGVAMSVCSQFGIEVARQMLRHRSISTTQAYTNDSISAKKAAQIYNAASNIKAYESLPDEGFDDLSLNQYLKQVEDFLDEDLADTSD